MSKYNLLKIASFYPIFYIPFFFIFGALLPLIATTHSTATLVPFFIVLSVLHITAMIDILFVYIYYLINVFKNDRVPQEERKKWFLLIFLGNIIAIPFYWNRFIKTNGTTPSSSLPQNTNPSQPTKPQTSIPKQPTTTSTTSDMTNSQTMPTNSSSPTSIKTN